MLDIYRIRKNGKIYGVFNLDQIHRMIAKGSLLPNDSIQRNAEEWMAVSDLIPNINAFNDPTKYTSKSKQSNQNDSKDSIHINKNDTQTNQTSTNEYVAQQTLTDPTPLWIWIVWISPFYIYRITLNWSALGMNYRKYNILGFFFLTCLSIIICTITTESSAFEANPCMPYAPMLLFTILVQLFEVNKQKQIIAKLNIIPIKQTIIPNILDLIFAAIILVTLVEITKMVYQEHLKESEPLIEFVKESSILDVAPTVTIENCLENISEHTSSRNVKWTTYQLKNNQNRCIRATGKCKLKDYNMKYEIGFIPFYFEPIDDWVIYSKNIYVKLNGNLLQEKQKKDFLNSITSYASR